ncbi:MAG TPA: outer membrane beta-barrel protein, partial [Candidatus Acidoferrum sp.]|nr:outer membrane beta-barrel protein [Candidatus Acidoferrum sp.]
MHVFARKFLCWTLLIGFVTIFLADLVPQPAFADDEKPKSDAPKASSKSTTPPELTERERWLLDRVEQLEIRVAELEGKRNAPAPVANAEVAAAPVAIPNITASAVPTAVAAPSAATTTASAVAPGAAPSTRPATEKASAKAEPFAFADFTWLNGNPRTKDLAFDTKFFTPEIRVDADYIYDFHHPKDDTIGGSSEVFRSSEVQLTQLGVGGDFHFDNVRARLMTQFGMYSQTTPRNDASTSRGQWSLDNAYRYISEAYGGYHFNALHGINLDAGIFMS